MTISTSLSSIYLATMLFGSRQRLHGTWRRAFDLRLELARGQNAQDHKGKDEKAKPSYKCNHKRIAKDRWSSVKDTVILNIVVASACAALKVPLDIRGRGPRCISGSGHESNPEQQKASKDRNARYSSRQPVWIHSPNRIDPWRAAHPQLTFHQSSRGKINHHQAESYRQQPIGPAHRPRIVACAGKAAP